jgi:hypothetical protein
MQIDFIKIRNILVSDGITYMIFLILAAYPYAAPREIRHIAPCNIIGEFKSEKSYRLFRLITKFLLRLSNSFLIL